MRFLPVTLLLVRHRARCGRASSRSVSASAGSSRAASCSSASGCCSCGASDPGDEWTALLAGFMVAGGGIGLCQPGARHRGDQRGRAAAGGHGLRDQLDVPPGRIAQGTAALGAIFTHVVNGQAEHVRRRGAAGRAGPRRGRRARGRVLRLHLLRRVPPDRRRGGRGLRRAGGVPGGPAPDPPLRGRLRAGLGGAVRSC